MRNIRIAQCVAGLTLVTCVLSVVNGDAWSAGDADGTALYEAACAACHGSDGSGRSADQVGFTTPVPDFTDCSFNSREQSADWVAIAHEGGPVRGFSEIMPAYGSAFTVRELEAIVAHVRGFCGADEWPRGELNMPRAMFTEKAFPEDEAVLTYDTGIDGATDSRLRLIWEKRFGARGQIELIVPYQAADVGAPDHWQHGFGDVAVGMKYAFAHNASKGYIWAAGGELALPTGDESRGFGNDSTAGELYLAFGKLLPADAFLQSRLLIEGQFSGSATREAAWQLALGKTWTSGPFGRSWTPMVELLAARELKSGATTDWDIVPQLQISLNQRQHLLFSIGAQLPLNDHKSRDQRLLAYVLWDWFDGGLRDGW